MAGAGGLDRGKRLLWEALNQWLILGPVDRPTGGVRGSSACTQTFTT